MLVVPNKFLEAAVTMTGAYPVEEGFSLGVSHAIEARDAPFFFGHKLKLSQADYGLLINYKRPAGMQYSLSLYRSASHTKDLKASQPGLGASLNLASYLSGDGILSLIWKWHLNLSGGQSKFNLYKDNITNIKHSYLISQAGLSTTSFIGVFSFTAGILFTHAIDRYFENISGTSERNSANYFIPFTSIAMRFSDSVSIALSGCLGRIESFKSSFQIAF